MIEILTSKNTFISSSKVNAVIFPCTSFEENVLWLELQSKYKFKESEIASSVVTNSYTIGQVSVEGKSKDIIVSVHHWNIKGSDIALISGVGDIGSYNLTKEWIETHFDCRWRGGTQRAIFDPWNLHNCIKAIEDCSS